MVWVRNLFEVVSRLLVDRNVKRITVAMVSLSGFFQQRVFSMYKKFQERVKTASGKSCVCY